MQQSGKNVRQFLTDIGVPHESEIGRRVILANPEIVPEGQKIEGVTDADKEALLGYINAKIDAMFTKWEALGAV